MVTLSISLRRAVRAEHLGRVVAAVVVCGMLAAGRPAAAVPSFLFQATSGTTMQQEVIGDAGGSSYTLANGWPAGQGLPTQMGGWPTSPFPPGFAPDVSFSGSNGISGYHTANLYLTEPALVRFEFLGRGNANFQNQFKVNGTVIYDTTTASTNGPNPTGAYLFGAGLVPFTYIANVTNQTGSGTFAIPNGSNTANPVNGAAFFLAFDPLHVGHHVHHHRHGERVYRAQRPSGSHPRPRLPGSHGEGVDRGCPGTGRGCAGRARCGRRRDRGAVATKE